MPITISNNIDQPMYVSAKVHESRDGKEPTVQDFKDLWVPASSFYTIPYQVAFEEKQDNKNISLKVELSQKLR